MKKGLIFYLLLISIFSNNSYARDRLKPISISEIKKHTNGKTAFDYLFSNGLKFGEVFKVNKKKGKRFLDNKWKLTPVRYNPYFTVKSPIGSFDVMYYEDSYDKKKAKHYVESINIAFKVKSCDFSQLNDVLPESIPYGLMVGNKLKGLKATYEIRCDKRSKNKNKTINIWAKVYPEVINSNKNKSNDFFIKNPVFKDGKTLYIKASEVGQIFEYRKLNYCQSKYGVDFGALVQGKKKGDYSKIEILSDKFSCYKAHSIYLGDKINPIVDKLNKQNDKLIPSKRKDRRAIYQSVFEEEYNKAKESITCSEGTSVQNLKKERGSIVYDCISNEVVEISKMCTPGDDFAIQDQAFKIDKKTFFSIKGCQKYKCPDAAVTLDSNWSNFKHKCLVCSQGVPDLKETTAYFKDKPYSANYLCRVDGK
jgi:hypothetical protein